jgi:hypothetical protein
MTTLRRAAATLLLATGLLHAELPPSAYEALQADAPEALSILVLRSTLAPSDDGDLMTVTARVTAVERTATDLRPGDIITITHTIPPRPPGFVGPSPVRPPTDGSECPAYLRSTGTPLEYQPAAGAMSFDHF